MSSSNTHDSTNSNVGGRISKTRYLFRYFFFSNIDIPIPTIRLLTFLSRNGVLTCVGISTIGFWKNSNFLNFRLFPFNGGRPSLEIIGERRKGVCAERGKRGRSGEDDVRRKRRNWYQYAHRWYWEHIIIIIMGDLIHSYSAKSLSRERDRQIDKQ